MSTMNTQDIIDRGSGHTIPLYARAPLILCSGSGVTVNDVEGKTYLDFVAGIAVNALGYGDAELSESLKKTIDDGLLHCSNLYWNPHAVEAASLLAGLSGMDEAFFCNSGAEANEAAIKLAHKWGRITKGEACTDIIAMDHSFHGRTCGALSATGQKKYRVAFEPLVPGFSYAMYNDLASVEALITPRTCAIMVEGIQGEGGIIEATDDFLMGLSSLARKHGLLLIMDEVQCGMGRTGDAFSWQKSGVKPDVMTLAKGLGGGVPVGAMVVGGKACGVLTTGDHGSTFGGNLLAMTAACVVLRRFSNPDFLSHVREIGSYLGSSLVALVEDFPSIALAVRGRGLIRGLQVALPPGNVVTACRERGVLIASAGTDVLRFVPPLVVSCGDCDVVVDALREIFGGVIL
ncbi:aspartate aminotransferase family protein [Parasphaerochaeta coccoides]|uniref:Acetylornithine/succinyldiaminopimelate aminotransferase n=1 Tax=Parasphaerochaeta coccoides (strain ATCC BAA-1237 / DSM 17374 / SPN1) TaxID=760011 RepID=F4GLD7_PARC1|nr:acetylornithine/succinylornithine family transaminase [Parasphaerochaeta coccoides]AEC02969.1 Acetylornithine/succinyldiaminopimelate aminotransferase [Parasphaerochaeta coccoides DSM 17374]